MFSLFVINFMEVWHIPATAAAKIEALIFHEVLHAAYRK